MRIPINLIKPSPNPVRTNWDKEKLNELAQSIKEQGQIVPIKVRPVEGIKGCPKHGYDALINMSPWPMDGIWQSECDPCGYLWDQVWLDQDPNEIAGNDPALVPFEIVHGHRRVEACKQAGLEDVEAVIDEIDEMTAFLQALSENVQRDDLEPLEEAQCYQFALKTFMSIRARYPAYINIRPREAIAKIMGISANRIDEMLVLLKEDKNIQNLIKKGGGKKSDIGELTPLQVSRVRKAIGSDDMHQEDRTAVLKKVAAEGLSSEQGQRLAQAYKAAPTEQAKQRLLEWEYSPTIHDPEFIKQRAKEHGPHDPIYRDPQPTKQDQWDNTPEIKMLLEGFTTAIKTFIELMNQIHNVTDVGKLAPEGRQFMAARLKAFRDKIDLLLKDLESDNG